MSHSAEPLALGRWVLPALIVALLGLLAGWILVADGWLGYVMIAVCSMALSGILYVWVREGADANDREQRR